MKNRELVYWVDLIGSATLDETVRLTIMDTNDSILFNHASNTRLVDWWYSGLNGIRPEETYNQQPFKDYKKEIQPMFSKASRLTTFNSFIFFLDKQDVTIPANTTVEDSADPSRVLRDVNGTIDNLCAYYGYPLSDNIYNRTGVDYVKAINYCWHEMERYKEAQENK